MNSDSRVSRDRTYEVTATFRVVAFDDDDAARLWSDAANEAEVVGEVRFVGATIVEERDDG